MGFQRNHHYQRHGTTLLKLEGVADKRATQVCPSLCPFVPRVLHGSPRKKKICYGPGLSPQEYTPCPALVSVPSLSHAIPGYSYFQILHRFLEKLDVFQDLEAHIS